MKCPYCEYPESKVLDSRPTDENEKIRRRRECLQCGRRFTTYEVIENVPIVVIKKDKSREAFDRNKLFNSMLKAFEKRTISTQDLDNAVQSIENQIQNKMEREISTEEIGELAMEKIKEFDQVAYVRYASVHRNFRDVKSFFQELRALLKEDDED